MDLIGIRTVWVVSRTDRPLRLGSSPRSRLGKGVRPLARVPSPADFCLFSVPLSESIDQAASPKCSDCWSLRVGTTSVIARHPDCESLF